MFTMKDQPRAFLAWECHSAPNPLGRWKRYCDRCAWLLYGATLRVLEEGHG